MSNTLMIHIGTPKTGTSALQQFFADNREQFKKRGWCYPDLESDWAQITKTPSVQIAKNARKVKFSMAQKWPEWKKELLWKMITNYLKKYNVILSDEGLWSYPTLNFDDTMKELRSRYDKIKVIVYLRRQDLYIESKWNQDVKAGFYGGDVFSYYELKKAEFDYQERLDTLAKIFGKENVIVRVYEKGQFGGVRGEITSDFLEACGIDSDWDEVNMPGYVNERIDNDVLGLKHLFNKKYSDIFETSGSKPSGQVMIKTHFSDMRIEQESAKLGYISKEERKIILDRYAAGNEYVAKEFLGRSDGKIFYDMNIDVPLYTPSFTEREELIVKLFAGIIAEQEKKRGELERKVVSNKKNTRVSGRIGSVIGGILERVTMHITFSKLDFK